MIALLKSFSLQNVGLIDSLGGNKIAGSFSVQQVRLTDSLGGNKITGSFSLAKGGYTIDGATLPLELDDSKILRVK